MPNLSHRVKRSADIIALLSLTSIQTRQPKIEAAVPENVQLVRCLILRQAPFFTSAKVSNGGTTKMR